MIVVDASALLEFLLQTSLGSRVEARLLRDEDEWHAPHLIDIEICQALRRLVRTTEISASRAQEVVDDLVAIDLHRHGHVDLVDRVFKLRDNISAYDAAYASLAEALEVPLITCDRPLSRATGHRARLELVI